MFFGTSVPAEEWRNGDAEGQDPDTNDEQSGPGTCHERRVTDRSTDGKKSVEADGTEVKDGGSAQPDINGQPDTAPERPKRPVPQHLVGAGKRKNGQAKQEIGHGKRDDESVGHGTQLPVRQDGRDD